MALFLGNSEQGWNWTKLSYHLPYTTIGGQTELAMHGYASALLHEMDISFWLTPDPRSIGGLIRGCPVRKFQITPLIIPSYNQNTYSTRTQLVHWQTT